MVLTTLISKETVALDIENMDKWTAIETLVDLIVDSGKSHDRDAILAPILNREHQGSTGIENGIAIPHARSDDVEELVVAVGVSKEGIDFDSVDGQPTHLIFALVAPTHESTRYLKALAAIAFLGENQEYTSRLRSAQSAEEVVSILESLAGASQ